MGATAALCVAWLFFARTNKRPKSKNPETTAFFKFSACPHIATRSCFPKVWLRRARTPKYKKKCNSPTPSRACGDERRVCYLLRKIARASFGVLRTTPHRQGGEGSGSVHVMTRNMLRPCCPAPPPRRLPGGNFNLPAACASGERVVSLWKRAQYTAKEKGCVADRTGTGYTATKRWTDVREGT